MGRISAGEYSISERKATAFCAVARGVDQRERIGRKKKSRGKAALKVKQGEIRPFAER